MIQSCPFSIISLVLYQSPYYQITTKYRTVVVNKIEDTMGMWLKQPDLNPVSVGWTACCTYSFHRKSINYTSMRDSFKNKCNIIKITKTLPFLLLPLTSNHVDHTSWWRYDPHPTKKDSVFIFECFCNLQVMISRWSFHLPIMSIYHKQATCIKDTCVIMHIIIYQPSYCQKMSWPAKWSKGTDKILLN